MEDQAVTEKSPEHCHQRHEREALHHGGKDVLLSNQTCVEERQTRAGHHKNQRRTSQHPGVVARAPRICNLLFELGQAFGGNES
jgi:hypothetical protein